MREISGRVLTPSNPYIIAEIGQNHDGDVYQAIRLVGMAVKCGVDAVKFQLRDCEAEYDAEVLDAPHPHPEHAFGSTYREHRQALDLTAEDLAHIKRRIEYNEWPVQMIVTPCALGCVEPLVQLNMPAYKIASKDMWNYPLIDRCLSTGRPVLVSTGMAEGAEWQAVKEQFPEIILMQCTSEYPCPDTAADLAVLREYLQWDPVVGFSDHTVGILAAPLAVSLGASVIEKHVTLARAAKGSDHAGALEEDGLKRLVRDCRNAPRMLGTGKKALAVGAAERRRKHARFSR